MVGLKAFLVVLLVMPPGHACTVIALRLPSQGQIAVTIICVMLAAVVMYISRFIKSSAWDTFCGLIAGTLLWAGLVEIWVKLGAKAIGAEEQKVMELTLAIIIPLILYFLFRAGRGHTSLWRRRRAIFVEARRRHFRAPSGAAPTAHAAPDGASSILWTTFYN